MVVINNQPLFFNHRNGPWFPTLRLLHLCMCSCARHLCFAYSISDPTLLPIMRVDKGAIKFVLQGANIMCPGLTSPGGSLAEVGVDTLWHVLFVILCRVRFFIVSVWFYRLLFLPINACI